MSLTRREMLGTAGATLLGSSAVADPPAANRDPFVYSLNTSTIRNADGQHRPITEEVDIASRAGYQAIEPWVPTLERYVQQGGSLRDLAQRIRDAGLRVESAIGFM